MIHDGSIPGLEPQIQAEVHAVAGRHNQVCIISEHQVARQISAVIGDTGPKGNRLPSQSLLTNEGGLEEFITV